jgi:RNA polymerase sigma-70 factor, ECF subfamily
MAQDPHSPAQNPAFVRHLTGCQSALYAFITTLLGGAEGAGDVLQETNVVLWNKAGDYDPQRPFLPWAYTFARFQVMAWRKKQSRDRLVLDDELVAAIASELEERSPKAEAQLEALEACLSGLPEEQRRLVDSRYSEGEAVQDIASRMGRPENVISAHLYRIRRALMQCVRLKMEKEAGW